MAYEPSGGVQDPSGEIFPGRHDIIVPGMTRMFGVRWRGTALGSGTGGRCGGGKPGTGAGQYRLPRGCSKKVITVGSQPYAYGKKEGNLRPGPDV